MKKKLIIIIAAVLVLGIAVGVTLGVRQCSSEENGGGKSDGTFNDPNALPWEPV